MSLLGLKKNNVIRFFKFILVGIFNTIVDIGIFNLLIYFSGNVETSTKQFFLFKAISFTIAVIISYFLNSYFVFQDTTISKTKLSKFIIISLLGLFINTSSSTFAFTLFGEISTLVPLIKNNISALVGSAAGALWNFFGYKIIVFKK